MFFTNLQYVYKDPILNTEQAFEVVPDSTEVVDLDKKMHL